MSDKRIIVCVKPAGVLSTDVAGGVPSLVREALGDDHACVRTVHRLDAAVSGLMLLARSKKAASVLGQQVMERRFEKEYLAVIHGAPEQEEGSFSDLLQRDKARRMTYVVSAPEKGAQSALLDYRVLAKKDGYSLVRIRLHTGRTHQIRVQFSSRGMPLLGDGKYGARDHGCPIGLWSYRLTFAHPTKKGQTVDVFQLPTDAPFDLFENITPAGELPDATV